MKKWLVYNILLVLLFFNGLINGLATLYLGESYDLWSLIVYVNYYIMLLLFAHILEKSKFENKKVRNIFIITPIVVFFNIIISGYISTFSYISINLIVSIIVYIVLSTIVFILNLYIKNKSAMEKEYNKMTIQEESEIFVEELKTGRKDVIISSYYAFIVNILILICYAIIPRVLKNADNRYRTFIFTMPFVFALLYINSKKNLLFYKKQKILEDISIIVSLTFLLYFEGVIYYKTGTINFVVYIISIFMLYAVFKTYNKISKKCREILKDNKI